MMPDEAAFLRTILAHPYDDAQRLIYADWLEERGDAPAANFLRTEVQLAKLSPNSPDSPPLRNRLWQAWATVDPRRLMTFTQPRMLRASPTPFPSAWMNFGLGTLRERQGTYGTWPYESLPPLPVDEFRGEFHFLKAKRSRGRQGAPGDPEQYRQRFEQVVADAAEKGVRLPDEFVKFMSEPALQNSFRSVTDCYWCLPDKHSPIRVAPFGEGRYVLFYRDSQDCLQWDLYVHASGAHCVVARWPDYIDQPTSKGPRAWFVAPSFEAFVYRVWVENQIWYIEHADFRRGGREKPPAITPEIQAYIDHYRNPQSQGSGKN